MARVGKLRVRVKPGLVIKLGRDRFVKGGEMFDIDAADLPEFSSRVETEEEIRAAELAAAEEAKPKENPLFMQLRNAARAQREIKRQALEADERRTKAAAEKKTA